MEFLHTLNECADFSAYDFYVELIEAGMLPELPEGGTWHYDRYYVHGNGQLEIFYRLAKDKDIYLHTIRMENEKNVVGTFLSGYERELCYSKNLFDWIGIENILLQYHAFILHASFIEYLGQGILLSAPSGTGKSTQADLWHQYRGAEIINGDRAAIRKLSDGWQAYGLPYAGSSLIYKQKAVPLKAIIMLEQAKVNEVQKLNVLEAFKAIFPEVSLYRWDEIYTSQAMELIFGLLADIPVYRLKCRPDEEAVEVLENTLFNENKEAFS